MKVNVKTAAGCAASAALLWALGLGLLPFSDRILVPCIVLAVAASICTIAALAILLVRRSRPQASPYKPFAAAVLFCAAAAAAFAFWDMAHSSGMMAGLLGTLILLFAEPVALLLLIIDYICWRISK